MNNEIFKKMKEIFKRLNNGCDLAYLEENTQFVLNIGKQYNEDRHSFSKEIQKIQLYRYEFFSSYFLIYMEKKYNMYFTYNLFSEKNNSYYSQFYNCINISKNYVGRLDFEHIVFIIFHEFRHRMQRYDIDNDSIDNILNIDPATIIFLKEEATQKDRKLYDNNHDCFFKENDANLFALSECELFFKVNLLKKIYRHETTNYISAMIQGLDLSDQEYHDKQSLPIVYEEDYRSKKLNSGTLIAEDSLLNLIYKPNGAPKTYDELLHDKAQLIERFKGNIVNKKTSINNYINWSSQKSSQMHIEEIYKLIVASDPLLTIQECLYRWNNKKNEISSKQHLDKIVKLLDDCPQLMDIYSIEIMDIFIQEIKKGNSELIKKIVCELSDEKLISQVNTIILLIKGKSESKSAQKKVVSSDEEYEMNKEKIPFSPNPKTVGYRPIIGEEAKSTEEKDQKKQKHQEMKQILNKEREEKQEKIDNQEEQEEDFGMSM